LLICENVGGLKVPVATNLFASRTRIARLFGVTPAQLHETFSAAPTSPSPRATESGPVLMKCSKGEAGSALLPMRHSTDRGPYITNAIIIAEDPLTGIANMSTTARCAARQSLATSLHSRGHLWRCCRPPVNAVKNCAWRWWSAHPLFMLAAAARCPTAAMNVPSLAACSAPLELVKTPRHGIVPAYAEFVLEGAIDPTAYAEEGPFGEFSGYSSDRSTNNVLRVDTLLRRRTPWLVDVMGGRYAEHLTLARLPPRSGE
jgi:UbiD family decarboxylase